MKKFRLHKGIALPLVADNIDTDQIIPSREMKKVSKVGLADGLFSGQRYLYDGKVKTGENPDFVLNSAKYQNASVLLSGKNFGCGSSREHAVWALLEYGFAVIIAESFGEIFHNNCLRNGLLPICLPADVLDVLARRTIADPHANAVTIDLQSCQVRVADELTFEFQIEEYFQKMLLNGWDFIDLALQRSDEIDQFIENDRKQRSWAYL